MEPTLAHVVARARIPRDRETDEVRHRAARDEQAVRARGQSEKLDEPADHLILHDCRRVVEFGDLWVHP